MANILSGLPWYLLMLRFMFRGRLGGGEEGLSEFKMLCSIGIGKKPEVANAVEVFWDDVEHESANELDGW